jgi:hypothetical protein
MINTPRRPEYSPVFQDAIKQLDKASSITSIVNELKALYSNKSKIESITELSVSGSGLKFTINENDDAFQNFIGTMIQTISSKIEQREKDIYNILNGEIALEVKSEA